jgi:catechol 2,3-dioxygenase-like lactoylglutathione lyase family enzyme
MVDHMGITVEDFERSRAFYEKALAPLGMKMFKGGEVWGVFGTGAADDFFIWIGSIHPSYWHEADGHRPGGAPLHLSLRAPDSQAVDAFYAAALAAGGRDNGAPGTRGGLYKYYAAFVLDPDGNNIEAAIRLKG